MSKTLIRSFELSRSELNEDQRIATVIASSENPVTRYDDDFEPYEEILSHSHDDIDLSRMPLPVFEAHEPVIDIFSNPAKVNLGIFENSRIDNRRLIGDIRLGASSRAIELWDDIKQGIIRYISVSYRVLNGDAIQDVNGKRTLFARWQPFEVSFVGIPADHNAQVIDTRGLKMDKEVNTGNESSHKETATQGNDVFSRTNENTTQPIETQTNQVDISSEVQKAQADFMRNLSARNNEIVELFKPFSDVDGLREKCLADITIDLAKARNLLLKELAERTPDSASSVRVVVENDSQDKFRSAATNVLLARLGKEKLDPQNEYSGATLLRMAEYAVKNAGISIAGLSPVQIASRALSTSDYPFILENIVNKELLDAYNTKAYTWSRIARIGTLNDFRPHPRLRLGSFSNLEEIPENAEYKAGSHSEEKETIIGKTMGRLLIMSRQMIVNDDLNAFSTNAASMGQAAGRAVENDYYAVLNSNPTMSDGNNFYSAARNNLVTPGTALDTTTLDELRKLIATQLDPSSVDYIDVMPDVLLVHEAQRGVALQLVNSQADPAAQNAGTFNYVANLAEVVATPRLATETEFHLIGDIKGIEVAFLNGQRTPYIEQIQHHVTDSISWKVRLEYAVGAIDGRVHAKNPGA